MADDVLLKIRQATVEWREIEGEIVAIDLRRSVYFALNRAAAALWPELLAGSTRESLIRSLAEQWSVAEAEAARDVDAFVAMLREQDLLEPEESLR